VEALVLDQRIAQKDDAIANDKAKGIGRLGGDAGGNRHH
jgi:hypothetical protein